MCQHPLAVRTWLDIVRGHRLFRIKYPLTLYLNMRAPVRPVIAQRNESLWRINVDTLLVMREVRAACAASRQDQIGIATVSGNPNKVCICGLSAVELAVFPVIRVPAQRHNFRRIRRPRWIAVHSSRFRQLLRCSSCRRYSPQLPALVRPGYVSECLAVRRPSRLKFPRVAARHATRLSVGQIQRVQACERGKCQLLPVRRLHWVLNQPCLYRPVFHALRKVQLRPQLLRNLGGERNNRVSPSGQIQSPNLSVLVEDDFLAIGQERISWEKIAGETRLLVIARNRIFDPAIVASSQVAE